MKNGVDFTLAPGPEADAMMRGDLDVEKVGEQGLNKPTIDSIALNPGGAGGRVLAHAGHAGVGRAFP